MCSWKKGVMGVKRGGRKEGRSWEKERGKSEGCTKMEVKGGEYSEKDRGRLNLPDGFMTRLFKGCLVALNL